MTRNHPPRAVAGAMRWWMPLLALLLGTAALVFAAWMGGVDMHAAAQRLANRLEDTFHHSSVEFEDERGSLLIEFDPHDNVKRAFHDNHPLPLEDVVIEDGYLTITSLKYDDGELMYWRIPLSHEGELREEARSPRWSRILMRIHPRPDGEPPGLRVARIGKDAAAARAGIEVGDLIVGVDGSRPPTSAGLEVLLQDAIARCVPGGTVTLAVERGGEPLELRLELQPLVSRQEWDSVDVEDPVERYLVLRHPRYAHAYERSVRVAEDARKGGTSASVEAPAEPPPPTPVPDKP